MVCFVVFVFVVVVAKSVQMQLAMRRVAKRSTK